MKSTLIKLVTITILLASCSMSDTTSLESNSIVGEWNSTSFLADIPMYDINGDGINSKELLDELSCRYSKLVLNEDLTFSQETNYWKQDEDNIYACNTADEIITYNGTWKINTTNTLLSLEVDGNVLFLRIQFDGETLSHRSGMAFFNLNAAGEKENIAGKISYNRN